MATDSRTRTQSRGLGRGLSALLGDEKDSTASRNDTIRTRMVPVAFLKPNPLQPRRKFDEEELASLAESIAQKGVLQPILVRPSGRHDSYEIIAGERRWRAAQRAKLHEVPVVVRELSDSESLE